jgi:hypothetical protein
MLRMGGPPKITDNTESAVIVDRRNPKNGRATE